MIGGTGLLGGTAKVLRAPAAAVFPVTSVLDNFNRADGVIGSNWSNPWLSGLGSGGCNIGSNTAGCGGENSYWNVATFGPRTEVYVKIVSPNSGSFPILAWRITSPGANPNCYFVEHISSSGVFQIFRRSSSTNTQLGADITQTLSNGDSFGISHDADLITLYYDAGSTGTWVSLGTRSDNTNSGAGYIGMYGSDAHFDNFGGGTM